MTKASKRGFSLIELMIGMTISIIVVGALAAAFSKINEGVRNAARSTDLSNNIRGVFQIFQQDLYQANVGLGDLNMLQVHVDNLMAPTEPYFYGISAVKYESGFSNITLQWFDYDLADATAVEFPTFVLMSSAGNESPWPPQLPATLQLLSRLDPDPALGQVMPGDFFLLYKSDPVYDLDPLTISQNVDGGDASLDELLLENGAMLVQVGEVAAGSAPGVWGGVECFPSALDVSFVGPVFGDDFSTHPVETNYTDPVQCFLAYHTSNDGKPGATGWLRPPPGTWLARKLGKADSYHRVNYRVVNNTLIRDVQAPSNQTMVMASNVERFDVEVGLDVIAVNEPWDGAVSVLDNDHWILDESEIGVGVFGAHMVGRHSQAVKVTLTMMSQFQDTSDLTAGGSTESRKTRTMVQTFKLRNAHLPLRNQ